MKLPEIILPNDDNDGWEYVLREMSPWEVRWIGIPEYLRGEYYLFGKVVTFNIMRYKHLMKVDHHTGKHLK